MDLPYPTKKQKNLTQQLNELDKLYKSILLSTRDIPKHDALPKQLKHRIKKYINDDKAFKLSRLIEEQAIRFDQQIGARGSRWNILHFCAKNNSCQCLHYLLRTHFQQQQEQYTIFVNSKTVEGYTPIVVAIMNRSNQALEILLKYGGIDIHVINIQKRTPYEVALNYKNDIAIRLLMSYESACKKKQYLNRKALKQGVVLESKERCCESFLDCLFNCFSFGMYSEDRKLNEDILRVSVLTGGSKEQQCIDFVQIGSKNQLPGYDIEWKKATEILSGKITLFDSYNPFSIRENNFTIKNQLIVFQSLSQQPWLLRKIIKPDRSKNNLYSVSLNKNKITQKITVDDYVPFIKQRNSPMFFSDEQELWPMILQKGLAKLHNGYLSTNEIKPIHLLEQLTGFHTVEIKLNSIDPSSMFEFLQELTAKSFIYFLRGKQKSQLCEKDDSIDCFNVLNFYEKANQSLVLVNCPFVQEQWKKKQKNQILALKLIKSHYNSPNQMTVWIDAKKLLDYFSSIVLSFSFPNYDKNEIKVKSGQIIFFKFKIENKRQDPIVFNFHNLDKDTIIPINNLQILKNDGAEEVILSDPDKFAEDLAYVECFPGEYMAFLEREDNPRKQENNILLGCWSIDGIQIEYVEKQFGVLEWYGCLKNRFSNMEQELVIECIGSISLILLKYKTENKVFLKRKVHESELMEGKLVKEDLVEMVSDKKGIFYCVLRTIIKEKDLSFEFE